MHVNDLITGEISTDEVRKLKDNALYIFRKDFTLQKWHLSAAELKDKSEELENDDTTSLKKTESKTTKILGYTWNKRDDTKNEQPSIKRTILWKLASIYDSLGLISPVTVSMVEWATCAFNWHDQAIALPTNKKIKVRF